MAMYLALLRGVNVGGRTVKMDRLRGLFEGLGFLNVRTYIQSGNVLFEAEGYKTDDALRTEIEAALQRAFGFEIAVVLLSSEEAASLLAANPYAGRELMENERVHVTVFQAEPSPAAVSALQPEPGSNDEFQIIGRAAYILCRDGYARTVYSNAFFEKKLKAKATTRNLDTMEKLAGMLRQSGC